MSEQEREKRREEREREREEKREIEREEKRREREEKRSREREREKKHTHELWQGSPTRGPAGWACTTTPTLQQGQGCDIDGAVITGQTGHGGTRVHLNQVRGDALSQVIQRHSIQMIHLRIRYKGGEGREQGNN